MQFLVLKPDYPHETASNSLFSIKKGAILECPPNYIPSNSFQVCETKEAAQEYIKLTYHAEQPNRPIKAEGDKHPAAAVYPLFRRVASPGGESQYQLFARDIHRFLSQSEEEVLSAMQTINLHKNTAQRLFNYEKKHFSRQPVLKFLEVIIKGEKKEEEKLVKGITTNETTARAPS